jgi:hypothetical protein
MHKMTKKQQFYFYTVLIFAVYCSLHLAVFIRRLFRDQMWKIYVLVGSARPERSIPQSRKYIYTEKGSGCCRKKAIATRHDEKIRFKRG